ncbi:hypothetical protein [Methyloprofundus sp.]|uniref:hypothetical protein n=1 Tax=Methyloprofundus sp. TaxID=2020875 RepID=UPI003D0F8A04
MITGINLSSIIIAGLSQKKVVIIIAQAGSVMTGKPITDGGNNCDIKTQRNYSDKLREVTAK